jgi:hypothetical protein
LGILKPVFGVVFGAMLVGVMPAGAAPRSMVQRDIEGYASAACLVAQDDAMLRQQGNDWAAIIINRSRVGLGDLGRVRTAVESAMRRKPMTVVHRDKPVAEAAASAQVFYCAEIIDEPIVRAAIDAAIRRLTAPYRRR